ncbi:TetR/AcrR family transcriptional regulator, partial [bacterium]|nr:TetR/AcrR family transcriptional regulator [bacterium]
MTNPELSNKPSRKELEKQQRRFDILMAAKTLFVQKGYHNTTLEEVAQLAEFGKGTIYNY